MRTPAPSASLVVETPCKGRHTTARKGRDMGLDVQTVKDAADLGQIVENLTQAPRQSDGLYYCPICHSGEGPNHSGAFHIMPDDEGKWYCHSCRRHGDVIDLAGYYYGTDDFKEKLARAAEWAGISDDDTPAARPATAVPKVRRPKTASIDDARAFRERCAGAIDNPKALAYLAGRGIDREAAHDFGLGWDARHSSIVIPYPGSDHYYTSRQVGREGSGKYYKPRGIAQPLWNPEALDGERVIVVEGQFDALALTLAGYGPQTVALGGTAYGPLMNELRARGYAGTVIVALDGDDAGGEAQASLVAELREAGIAAAGLDVWGELGVKDAGEAWETDRDALAAELGRAVAEGADEAARDRQSRQDAAFEATLKRQHLTDGIEALQDVILLKGAVEPLPTGIRPLDEGYLGGGMRAGLYILGAISSMGKTTLLGQIADHAAASGRPVLFVTLEQSAQEMQQKTLSRLMATRPGPDGKTREIAAGNFFDPSWREGRFCGRGTLDAMMDACEHYERTYSRRVRYAQADRDITVRDVETMAEHIRNGYGEPPLVVIDYLQLLRPYVDEDDARAFHAVSEKENTDRNVTALRRLARDMGTPVLAVSSLNRGSYSGVVNMEAFKESGAIEYGSDVLMGLQPYGMGETAHMTDAKSRREARDKINQTRRQLPVRDVELSVIKNRSGRTTGDDEGIHLRYHVLGNFFEEARR